MKRRRTLLRVVVATLTLLYGLAMYSQMKLPNVHMTIDEETLVASSWRIMASTEQQQQPPAPAQRRRAYEETTQRQSTSSFPLRKSNDTTVGSRTELSFQPQNDKPTFVIHIGPPKTATSSIQCGLDHYSEYMAQHDNYYFLGTVVRSQCRNYPSALENVSEKRDGDVSGNALTEWKRGDLTEAFQGKYASKNATKFDNGQKFQRLQQFLQHHRDLGHSMVFSTEHMSSNKAGAMISRPNIWKDLLEGVGFRVKVVVAYRHYFEWWKSYHYQAHVILPRYTSEWPERPSQASSTSSVASYNANGSPKVKRKRIRKTNDTDDGIHPPFSRFLQDHLDQWEANGRDNTLPNPFSTHLSLGAFLKWSKTFEDMHVLNLHQDGDVFTNFACQTMPHATALCNMTTTQQHTNSKDKSAMMSENTDAIVKARKSDDLRLEMQRVVGTAFHRGMVEKPDVLKRGFAVKAARTAILKLQLLNSPEYMTCLSQELEERFFNASKTFLRLTYEAAGPAFFQERDLLELQEEHDGMFWRAKAKHKFCEYNVEKLLDNERFRKLAFGHPPSNSTSYAIAKPMWQSLLV